MKFLGIGTSTPDDVVGNTCTDDTLYVLFEPSDRGDGSAVERLACSEGVPIGHRITPVSGVIYVHSLLYWWSYRDSNPGPLPCHGSALVN
jgi:hypothetical protein